MAENWQKISAQIESAYKNYVKNRKAGNDTQTKRWTTRLYNLESKYRRVANRRLRERLSEGIGEKMGWYDKILSYAEMQGIQRKKSNTRRILSPQTPEQAYDNLLVEQMFLKSKTSTKRGVKEVLRDIRKKTYYDFNISDNDFYEFWRWRQLNPVYEFFKVFPPSPPELRGSVGTMVIDLWNSGETQRKMMYDYFTEWLNYKENSKKGTKLKTFEVIAKLDTMYAQIGKRRRF